MILFGEEKRCDSTLLLKMCTEKFIRDAVCKQFCYTYPTMNIKYITSKAQLTECKIITLSNIG